MRLRFAPSPTGYLHIGNARTAVCNHVIAKKFNATLVLRVEDTDLERSSAESEESILNDLRWLGIEWHEGPDKGGDHGPYRQSERFDIYGKYTKLLLEKGHAYHCYCTQDELEEMRKEAAAGNRAFEYDGRCRRLSAAQRSRHESEGRRPTVRFHVPEGRAIEVNDLVKGKVVFSSEHIGGDFIIVRSDGVPVYNYIVIIDDALMKITHVIRGEDHLPNTPKQILLASALSLPVPQYAHIALVLGPDRSKLSKRHGITSVDNYRREGYLPEALVNYLAMLGWAAESGQEILPIRDIVEQIEVESLSRSAAVFDFQKLRWMNAHYIRGYPTGRITDLFIPYIEEAGYACRGLDRGWLEQVADLLRGNCETLADIKKYIGIFLDEVREPDEEASALLAQDDSKKVVREANRLIGAGLDRRAFTRELVEGVKSATAFKGRKLFLPLRAILTGMLQGPELDMAVPLIGYARCRRRIEHMNEKYG
jgi:nondiscriminating glutamyl-tRNA synthetase